MHLTYLDSLQSSFDKFLLWPLERRSASVLVWRRMEDTGMSGETDGEIRGAGSRNSAGEETRIGVLRK